MLLPEAPFPDEIKNESPSVEVEQFYQDLLDHKVDRESRAVTPFPAKSIQEVPALLKEVIEDFETRTSIVEDDQIFFTVDNVDLEKHLEAITFKITRREPGGIGKGTAFAQEHRNLRPFLREEGDDPDNPGYKIATYGQWFDNIVCLTCWARTSWQAEVRAQWLEEIIDKYTWYLTMKGIPRIFFWGRDEDEEKNIKNNIYYGKALNFYVRTERLTHVSMKTLEKVIIKLGIIGGNHGI